MYFKLRIIYCLILTALSLTIVKAQNNPSLNQREHIKMDFDWRFALGHPYDTKKDFNNGTGYFSYLAKTGYGDGAAGPDFDDRAWRKVDLPHDWAVELGFDERGSASHGFKAVGRNFPESSVGWYRKKFSIPAADLGRHISIAFDGVFRNSIVWVNGHYLGTEPSGYNGFEYDISAYLNYGGDNIIAVRANATMEEGWFYEGAGIYRHVWLNKTNPLHVAINGTFVTTQVNANTANVNITATVTNDDIKARHYTIVQTIIDAQGDTITKGEVKDLSLMPFNSQDVQTGLTVADPKLWSIETPYLYKLITAVKENGVVVDQYKTTFGIRTIRFDANAGFFLNGKHVEIKGTDNHQDHAGVGTAMPDALQDFRISVLKSLGSNAYRCSHNPPTPELLDACDRLGMLVIDENREMGISSTQLNDLKRLIIRDRNHPSVVAWSIGNEEWAIENNITGARIATTMQAFAKSIDSTRYTTAAFSGGVGSGISNVLEVLGYNYVAHKNTDEHHQQYPNQFSWGTEEGSTVTTRGVYFDDSTAHRLMAYDRKQNNDFLSLENGWKYYATRPYLAGMCIWTGFDYRGEPTPFGWPSIESYFGMVDACGFLKDDAWYLRAWWADKPIVHLLPHWNWKGKEGQSIRVVVYSNCDEVALWLNGKSLGKKTMELNGHLEWQVAYAPGTLKATGYKNGVKIAEDVVKTTGDAKSIAMQANKPEITADKQDIALVTVQANDKKGLAVPTALNDITFSISGPGKIIGVGNGDNTSLEPDQFLEKISTVSIEGLKAKPADSLNSKTETAADYDDSTWPTAFRGHRGAKISGTNNTMIYRGSFTLPDDENTATITYYYRSIGKMQSVYVNGKLVGDNLPQSNDGNEFKLDSSWLHAGRNTIAIVAIPLTRVHSWDNINTNPGMVQLIYPAPAWKRKLFNGLAQVIVQSTGQPGEIVLTATSPDLKNSELKINALAAGINPGN